MNLSNSHLPPSDRTRLEEFLLEFDQNWTEHHLSIMAGQLEAESPEFKAVALVEFVKIDLDHRYRKVQPTQIEWYLKRFPELRESPDTVAELLQAEVEVWLIADEAPSIADLSERFPLLQSQLATIVERAQQGKVRSLALRARRQAEEGRSDKSSLGSTASIALAAQETLPPTSRQQNATGQTGESLGDQFGRYRLLQELGRGAMGTVYLAEDTELRRHVALKRPRIGENESAAILQRFYREAYAAATLNHPNICPVYDIGEHESVPYITMAYVEGKTLSRVIRESRALNPRAVALLVRKIALALAEAHDKGVIHRDLKPGNIMLNHRSEPIVMDFGLARQVEHADDRLSVDGMLIGTPGYMSPEQVDGDLEKVGRASDIYSLGVVLFELLTGRLPFQGSVAAVIGKILRDEAPAPSSLRAGLPDKMDAICLKMMAKSPSDRYASMTEVAEALASLSKKIGEETTTAAPPPAAPTTTAQLAAQRKQISQMIQNGQWREASLQLQRMSELQDPVAAPYVDWAREQMTALHVRWEQEQAAAARLLAEAKEDFARHDYAGAAQRLVKIDKQLMTVESQQLLDESFKLAEEVDLLIHLIEQGLNGGIQAGMFRNMQRLLQLKPRDPLVRDLYRKFRWQQRLGWFGATLADAFAMSGFSRMRTTIEEPMYRKWFALAALVFLISFGLMSWHVAAYLRGSKPALDVVSAEPTDETTSDVAVDGGLSQPYSKLDSPSLSPRILSPFPFPDDARFKNARPVTTAAEIPATSANPDSAARWEELFNGRDLSGWKVLGESTWKVNGGAITGMAKVGKVRGWLMSDREYSDYELELDYRLSKGSNSGIFLRAWPDAEGVGREFGEIQLLDDNAEEFRDSTPETRNGSLFGQIARLAAPSTPTGQWHRVRARVVGNRLEVWINETQVLNHVAEILRPTGHIGLQPNRNAVEFRNIRVRSLADAEDSSASSNPTSAGTVSAAGPVATTTFTPPNRAVELFNGRDLTGWKASGNASWTADNNTIVCRSTARAVLWTDIEYDNFEFEFEVKLATGANSGVFLRASRQQLTSGTNEVEVQLNDDTAPRYSDLSTKQISGALYNLSAARSRAYRSGQWNRVRIRAEKRLLQVWLNDLLVQDCNFDDFRSEFKNRPALTRDKGFIGLQSPNNNRVEFRNLRITALR